VIQEVAQNEEKSVLPLSEADIILNTVASSGTLISSGMLQVPHASQVEMRVKRQYSEEMIGYELIFTVISPDEKGLFNQNMIFIVLYWRALSGNVGPSTTRKNINISMNTTVPESEVFDSSRIYFEVRAMEKKSLENHIAALNSSKTGQDALLKDPLKNALSQMEKCFCSPTCSEPLSTCLHSLWRCTQCNHENRLSVNR